jgi:hypothetical protein
MVIGAYLLLEERAHAPHPQPGLFWVLERPAVCKIEILPGHPAISTVDLIAFAILFLVVFCSPAGFFAGGYRLCNHRVEALAFTRKRKGLSKIEIDSYTPGM